MNKRKAPPKAKQALDQSDAVALADASAPVEHALPDDADPSQSGVGWIAAVAGQKEPESLAGTKASWPEATEMQIGDAKPFKLGVASSAPMSALPALDRMNERLARRIRSTVEPIARVKLKVASQPVQTLPFNEWQALNSDFCSLSVMSFLPLNATVGLMMQPMLIARLVDTYYGGSGNIPAVSAKEFTPSEEKMVGKLVEALIGSLEEVWSEIVPANFRLRTRESNISFANFARPDEPIAIASFLLEFNAGPPEKIDLIYPIATLRQVERDLSSANKDERAANNNEWHRRLNLALREVRMRARTVLARPELNMSELMQLSPGDIIPLNLSGMVPLIVQNREIALGTIGEHNGRAALKIEIMNSKDKIR